MTERVIGSFWEENEPMTRRPDREPLILRPRELVMIRAERNQRQFL